MFVCYYMLVCMCCKFAPAYVCMYWHAFLHIYTFPLSFGGNRLGGWTKEESRT